MCIGRAPAGCLAALISKRFDSLRSLTQLQPWIWRFARGISCYPSRVFPPEGTYLTHLRVILLRCWSYCVPSYSWVGWLLELSPEWIGRLSYSLYCGSNCFRCPRGSWIHCSRVSGEYWRSLFSARGYSYPFVNFFYSMGTPLAPLNGGTRRPRSRQSV